MIERGSLSTKNKQSIPVNERLSLIELRVMWAGNWLVSRVVSLRLISRRHERMRQKC